MIHVKASIAIAWLVLISGAAGAADDCADAGYEKTLQALRALTPSVLAEQPEQAALVSFFRALPPDFPCFNRLFGFGSAPAPLYSEPQLYLLFPKIARAVPEQEYARKLVGLSVKAQWEADQTGALQAATRSVLDTNTPLFAKLLAELSQDSEKSVWEFLFGAPHPSNEPLSAGVQDQLCQINARSCELSQQVFARSVSDEHDH